MSNNVAYELPHVLSTDRCGSTLFIGWHLCDLASERFIVSERDLREAMERTQVYLTTTAEQEHQKIKAIQ